MPRPKSRTDTDIAEAALAVLAREGHAMLSMRSVVAGSPSAPERHTGAVSDVLPET